VLGRGELQRAAETRRDLLTLTWLFATVVGATILLWNRAFLALWVGPVHYAGLWVNLLIVLAAVQTAFIRVDASVIDAALRPRERVLVGAAAAVLTIAASVLLSRALGLVGLCAGMLLGRAVQSVAYPLLARRSLGRSRGPAAGVEPVRLVGTTALIFAGAASLGDALLVSAWPVWALGVGATLPALTGLTLLLGPTVETRERLLERARALRRGGWPRWR
jgi:O-antigen/teichoic acid export membrane protein